MKDTKTTSSTLIDPTAAARQVARELQLDAEGSVVALELGDPSLKASADEAQWDWDMESVAAATRCQECGSSTRVFREPDGRILCETCLLRGPAMPRP
jgi:hypothetical protein